MSTLPQSDVSTSNNLATFSMVSGIIGWLFFLLLLCSNFIIIPMVFVTMGVGAIIYFCLIPLGCIPPLAWLGAVIGGHISKNQISSTQEGNLGTAKAGLIMGYIGLGLVLVSACLVGILIATGASIPFLESFDLAF
jgi:hypothetical protein